MRGFFKLKIILHSYWGKILVAKPNLQFFQNCLKNSPMLGIKDNSFKESYKIILVIFMILKII
jgi:hypothetical protein